MTGIGSFRPPPKRHWRSYGTDPLPAPAEAMDEPFAAFPSWFLRIECDRCGKVQMVNESHAKWRDQTLRTILAKMRHDGCGGLAGKAEPADRHRGRVQPAGAEDRAEALRRRVGTDQIASYRRQKACLAGAGSTPLPYAATLP